MTAEGTHIAWWLDTLGRMARCQSVAALIDLAYDAIRDGLGYDRVGLSLADPARRTLVEHVGTDAQGRKFYPHQRIVPLGDGGYYGRLLALPAMQPAGPGYVYLANAVRDLPPEVHDRLDGQPGPTLRVALRTADAVIGLLSVDNLISGRPVCPEDAPPLVAFATSLATAVMNARLLEENARRIETLDADLRHRVDQLTWLQEAAARLAVLCDRDSVLDTIYACLRHHYDRVGLFLFEEDGAGQRVSREVRGTDAEGQPTHGLPDVDLLDDPNLVLHSPDIHHLVQGHAYYYCADRWNATPDDRRAGLEGHMREQLAVALRHEDALVGYLSVDNLLSGRPIVEADAPPLLTFAAQAALAIDRARLWAAHEARGHGLARRVRELEWLRDMSRRITVARTRAEVLDVVYTGVRAGLGYDRAGITLFDHEAGVVEDCIGTDAQGQPLRPMDRMVGLGADSPLWRLPGIAALLRGADYYYTPDAYTACPPELRYLFDGAPRHNLMVPLRAGARVIGMISVDNLLTGRPIAPEEAGPLLAVANQVATAMENARLLEQERAEQARLQQMATTDALTGLANRGLLHERLTEALHAAQRERTPLALLLLDLDRFKEVNDTLGHQVGDVLLQQVALRMRQALRLSDTVARLGGDEFGILLPATDADGADHVARALLAALHDPVLVDDHALDVGASIGIAVSVPGLVPGLRSVATMQGTDAQALLRRADVAMYAAKRAQSGYAHYDAAADQHSPHRLALVSALRQAIAEDTLQLYYQPKVALASDRLCGVEALLRWPHAEHGFIPPDDFIPLAEHSGLIGPLTEWVLHTALRQGQTWQRGRRALDLAVNLSARTLHDAHLPDLIESVLCQYAVAPDRLTLEITEGALMVDPARAREILTRLATMGVRLAIDDFGTGYSSLGYLKRLPVDEVKIDKSFVLGLGQTMDLRDTAIVRAVVAMAHALGLAVVAEGVENQAAWDLLRTLRCDVAQGHYLSRPLPAAEVERWMHTSPYGVARASA